VNCCCAYMRTIDVSKTCCLIAGPQPIPRRCSRTVSKNPAKGLPALLGVEPIGE
jgi:hypothetical protein